MSYSVYSCSCAAASFSREKQMCIRDRYKTTIVDRVEGMEPTFAHLIPEMTANVLVPLVIIVYLFVMDWRMALLSLVTLVVGLAVMSAGMKDYPVKWEGAVKAGKQMANAIVE